MELGIGNPLFKKFCICYLSPSEHDESYTRAAKRFHIDLTLAGVEALKLIFLAILFTGLRALCIIHLYTPSEVGVC